ncbi:expansin-B18-like [Impatiens glandulifera]|uniref:expansin-B18-like n=1 Tax=Impatiens glandulifera TaxID=253017 RepID=UPI001FB13AF3|nr:expansin-B18-like [Impatiens glandulifera]
MVIGVTRPVYAFHRKVRNAHNVTSRIRSSRWSIAKATWYGSPSGAGSDGGACGYQTAVNQAPFSKMVSAGSNSLFASGKGCGACYQVMCTRNQNAACSGKPVTVVITDQCPGCESTHFDLSGTAFGAMAKFNKGQQLRNAGTFNIQYRRVSCNYRRNTLTFQVDSGANPHYFSVLIKYENGDGSLSKVELKESNSMLWKPMQQSWGAIWKVNSGSPLRAPLSLKLTSEFGQKIVANKVIPAGWKPGKTYRSIVNFHN